MLTNWSYISRIARVLPILKREPEVVGLSGFPKSEGSVELAPNRRHSAYRSRELVRLKWPNSIKFKWLTENCSVETIRNS